jgi:hypothetical protein
MSYSPGDEVMGNGSNCCDAPVWEGYVCSECREACAILIKDTVSKCCGAEVIDVSYHLPNECSNCGEPIL